MANASGGTLSYGVYAYTEYTTSSTNTTTTLSVSKAVARTALPNVGIDGISAQYTGTGKTSKSASGLKMRSSADVTCFSAFTWSWTRGHSAATKTINFKVTSDGGTSTASYTVSVPAKPSDTVSYNANGGTGTLSSDTKWYGETLVLKTGSGISKTGYTFKGWATSQARANAGTVDYSAGGNYTANASASLWAVWQINTWTVTYNANTGSGSIANQTKVYGTNLTLSNGAGFTKSLYDLDHWNTADDDTGTSYALSDTYSANANVTLYAIWSLAYVKPTITDFQCYRVASNGSTTETDDGTYIYITFNWTGGDAGNGAINPTCAITIGGSSVYNATISTTPFQGWYGTYSKDSSIPALIANAHS